MLLAQLIGFAGLLNNIISLQQSKKINVLIFQIMANLCYFIQYLLLGGISASLVSFLAIFRSCVYYYYDVRSLKKPNFTLIIFITLTIILGVMCYNNPLSLIPIITSIMYTYAIWQNDLKKFRVIAIIVPILWIVYNHHVNAYIAVISCLIEFLSALVAIIRLDFKLLNRRNKNECGKRN